MQNGTGASPANRILMKKKEVRGFTLPDGQAHPSALVSRTVWSGWLDRHLDHGNGAGSPEIDPHKNVDTNYDEDGKPSLWRKDHLFNKQYWARWHSVVGTKTNQNQNPPLKPHSSYKNWKWTTDFSVDCKYKTCRKKRSQEKIFETRQRVHPNHNP